MTKEHVLGTNVQNHNSRTPPIIMAPRGRWLKGNVRKIGEMQIVPGWKPVVLHILWSFRQNDHHLCACECVCVRHPLNLDLCDNNMTFCAHCGSQMTFESLLCHLPWRNTLFFSYRKKIQYVKIWLFFLKRNKGCFTFYILNMFMHLKLCKCCN